MKTSGYSDLSKIATAFTSNVDNKIIDLRKEVKGQMSFLNNPVELGTVISASEAAVSAQIERVSKHTGRKKRNRALQLGTATIVKN